MTGKFTGLGLDLPQAGRVYLADVLAQTTETELYFTDCPGIVVKVFDLECGQPDEISYGPYLEFKLELANYEDIQKAAELASFVPAYHGARLDYERKHACIAMEFLDGQNLKSWCEQGVEPGQENAWLQEFRQVIYETLAIIRIFHAHGIILLDLKPENILRLRDGAIRLVDLGALFIPRHAKDLGSYVYSATPEHAEVLIDASNLQSGLALTEASDIFSAGVLLFEMATGASRLMIGDDTANEMLEAPELYRFLDSQIRDIWHGFPHLRDLLPLIQTQLTDRRLLFSEAWHLLKAYVASKVADWESLEPAQQDRIVLATSTTFILDQLPSSLNWLAGPIAHATALRSTRMKTIAELMRQLADPISEEIRADLLQHSGYAAFLRSWDVAVDLLAELNSWDVRMDHLVGHWAVAASIACRPLSDSAQFVFLKQTSADAKGDHFYRVVDELDADEVQDGKLTLSRLRSDRQAWVGSS
jgi:serine/threonine protein kinase